MEVPTSSFDADLRCPDDAHLLRVVNEGRVTYAVCRHCDGVWFSRKAIEGTDAVRFSHASGRPRNDPTTKVVRSCPECSVRLDTESVDDVVIDVCPKCGGVWLDPGEYQAARRRSARIRLEQNVPSLKPRRSKVGKAFEWVLDLIGERFIEEHPPQETLVLGPFRRKPHGRK